MAELRVTGGEKEAEEDEKAKHSTENERESEERGAQILLQRGCDEKFA